MGDTAVAICHGDPSHRWRARGAEPSAPVPSAPLGGAVQDAVRPLPSWSPAPQQGADRSAWLCPSVHLTAGMGLLGHEAAVCPIGFCCDWQMKQPLGKLFPSIFGLGTFLNMFGAGGAGAGEA